MANQPLVLSPVGAAFLPLPPRDRDALASHPPGLVGGEKERNLGDVLGLANSPHWKGEAERLRTFGAQARRGEAFSLGHAGRDGVDPDSLASKLSGELARDRVDRAL